MSHIRLENYKRKCQIISTMLVRKIIILPLMSSTLIYALIIIIEPNMHEYRDNIAFTN